MIVIHKILSLFKKLFKKKEDHFFTYELEEKDHYPRKFYIAHSIIHRAEVKRTCLKLQKIGIETVNPFYLPDGSWRPERPEIQKIDEGKMDPYFIPNTTKAREIVMADLKHIDEADGVIAIMKEASIGTAMESYYCSQVKKKPLFVVTEKFFKHAWIMTFATKIFKNEDQLIKWYKKTYLVGKEEKKVV